MQILRVDKSETVSKRVCDIARGGIRLTIFRVSATILVPLLCELLPTVLLVGLKILPNLVQQVVEELVSVLDGPASNSERRKSATGEAAR